MKKWIKSNLEVLIAFIIGGIAFAAISVCADVLTSSSLVSFQSSNTTVTNVEDALNELYEKTNGGDATADDIAEGKTAIVNGQLIVGTGKLDTRDRIYELELYQHTTMLARNNTTTLSTVNLSWGSTVTLYDENDNVVQVGIVNSDGSTTYADSFSIGTSNGRYNIDASNRIMAKETKRAKVIIPHKSNGVHTYKVVLNSRYAVNTTTTYRDGNYTGYVKISDVTDVDSKHILTVAIDGVPGDQLKELPVSSNKTAEGYFTNE